MKKDIIHEQMIDEGRKKNAFFNEVWYSTTNTLKSKVKCTMDILLF